MSRQSRAPSWGGPHLLWPLLLLLVAIGVTASAFRIAGILTGWSTIDTFEKALPHSLIAEFRVAELWYAAHGRLTLLHVVPGAVFLLAVPFQVAERLRRKHPGWHRWTGRTLVAIGVPMAVSGLALGAASPISGFSADSAIFLFGALFLLALGSGYLAARRRDFQTHREWMLRATAVAAGIATIRIIALPLHAIIGGGAQALIGPSFWLGLGISCAGAEWWLQYTRRKGRSAPSQAARPANRP